MNKQDVKLWLNRAYKIDELIKLDKKKIEEWEELAQTIGGFSFEEKVQTSVKNESPFINKLLKKDEAIKKLKERIIQRHNIKEEIDKMINSLQNNEIIQILDYRYLQFLKFRDIASIMYMSIGNIQRLHDKGINLLGTKLKK